jgi:DNA-binding Lrp family transcriptional regulator
MTDHFLDKCGGFTPAPDELAKKYGFETAYLWGKLRRFCQLGGGTYTASHEAIGDRIGMSRRNLIERLNRLIKDGYVEDLDAGVKNRAHTYSVKKGEAKILSGMQISHTESEIPTQADNGVITGSDIGMRNLHTSEVESANPAHLDPPAMQNLPSESAEFAHQEPVGMQNLHLKRDSSLIGINPSIESKRGVAPAKFHQPIVLGEHGKALLKICKLEWDFVETDKAALGAYKRIQAFLIKKGATPGDIAEFDVWRRAHHWTGNSPPRITQVGEYWPLYREWVEAGRPAPEKITQPKGQNNGHKPTKKQPTDHRPAFERDGPPTPEQFKNMLKSINP